MDKRQPADNNKAYYYHFDGLGSVVALSDSNGDSCQSYEYSAYGQVAASDPNFLTNPYMFTGRRFDIEIRRPGAGRAGLYYYRARYYNPHIGRFMQTDPVGYNDGINWYLYCKNNPIAFVDPSGSICLIPWIPTHGLDEWGIMDFWRHYYLYGNGQPVDLRNIGLLDDFMNNDSINDLVKDFESKGPFEAAKAAEYYPSDTIGEELSIGMYSEIASFSFDDHLVASVIFDDPLVVIGDAELAMTTYIFLTKVSEGVFEYKIEYHYRLYNEIFTDPYDLGDWFEGEWDPIGDPFRIKASWINIERGTIAISPEETEDDYAIERLKMMMP